MTEIEDKPADTFELKMVTGPLQKVSKPRADVQEKRTALLLMP